MVETPTKLDDRQHQLLTELAALRGEDGHSPAKDESLFGKLKGKSRRR